MTMERVIAIDWSGAKLGAERKIWIAEARDGDLVLIENGRSREEVTRWLIEEAGKGDRLLVGIDFAFSTPVWFLAERGFGSARDLWLAARESAEEWLRQCDHPFWGRPGKKCVIAKEQRFRRTEDRTSAQSVFQIGGAGAVGTGSLRGLTTLCALQAGGFDVWPFDDPSSERSLVVEIYPRVWSPGIRKTRLEERRDFLKSFERFPRLRPEMRARAASTDDSFDAAVSALGMDAHRSELSSLPRIADEQLRAEGIIWRPEWRELLR